MSSFFSNITVWESISEPLQYLRPKLKQKLLEIVYWAADVPEKQNVFHNKPVECLEKYKFQPD